MNAPALDAIGQLFTSGRAVDVVLVIMVLEGLGLLLWRRVSGSGPGGLDIAGNLAAGAALLLALRAALTGAHWIWIAAALTASLAAHVFDLTRRWRVAGRHSTVHSSKGTLLA